MPAVFISHSSQDNEVASDVKSWLREQGFENVFLDFDKDTGIGAGKDWARTLYSEVSRCQAAVIIATDNWARSRWCFAEAQQALALGKTVLPVVTVPGALDHLGPELQRAQAIVWEEAGRASIASRLRSIVDELARGYRWDSTRPPWVGIHSLENSDAAVFFGRDQEVIDIVQRLDAKRALGGAPLTLLVGASGSGKSSLMKAGVLPYLSKRPQDWIALPPIRPSSDPVGALIGSVVSAVIRSGGDYQHGEDAASAIVAAIQVLRRGRSSEATILLAIDQFEELFTIASSEQRTRFLEIVQTLLGGVPRVSLLVLATIRSDRLGDVLAEPVPALKLETLTVAAMPTSRLRSVIEGPARVAGLALEPALVDRMLLDATNEGDALPLVAFALRDMYERREGKTLLTLAQYDALGDAANGLNPLENVIRRTAETVTAAVAPNEEQLLAVKEAFVASLVRVDETGARISCPARLADMPQEARPALDALVQARLLTTRGEGDKLEIEVSHDALLRVWPTLAGWLDEEQEFLLGRRQLEEARYLWTSAPADRKADALLSGLLLERARQWFGYISAAAFQPE